jgi:nucleotide-binding universal stress UspA family protein
MQTIVVAFDADEASRVALDRAADLAEAFHARLVVVSVAPVLLGSGRVPGGIDPTDPPERHAEQVDEATALLAARGAQAEAVVAVGHPEEAIVTAARDQGADLIVIGHHGAGLLGRLFGHGVAEGVVHRAPCDVYVAQGEETR